MANISLVLMLCLHAVVQARGGRFGGRSGGRIGGSSSFGRTGGRTSSSSSSSGWFGSSRSSFGSRYTAPTGRYSSYSSPVSRSYSSGYGRSSSSGGFGLGLGGGLLLGYSLGRVSGGYGGYGYGHNYGQYSRGGGYSTERPLKCYKTSKVSEITADLAVEENLVTCDFQDDVCYGKVVLTVSNSSTDSRGILEVTKGCGMRMVLEAQYQGRGKYNSGRQCYVTNVIKNNKVINNNFEEGNGTVPVLSDATSSSTSTSSQEEMCMCDGSQCNAASLHALHGALIVAILVGCANKFA